MWISEDASYILNQLWSETFYMSNSEKIIRSYEEIMHDTLVAELTGK
jgi:hypothetical protein